MSEHDKRAEEVLELLVLEILKMTSIADIQFWPVNMMSLIRPALAQARREGVEAARLLSEDMERRCILCKVPLVVGPPTCPDCGGHAWKVEGGREVKYRKKPVVIEAVQWTGKNLNDLLLWAKRDIGVDLSTDQLKIKTLEGVMTADLGDWIIRGVKGEYYPCKPDIFEATYTAADSPDSPDPLLGLLREARDAFENLLLFVEDEEVEERGADDIALLARLDAALAPKAGEGSRGIK